MKLVVDTNVLFSFFNERSKVRELAVLPSLDLRPPKFALEEVKEHEHEILERFSLSGAQFSLILKLLDAVVDFVEEGEYGEFLPRAGEISPDPDDVDFFALALKFNCPIWSEDKELKRQTQVKVLSTKELVEFLKASP